MKNTKTLYKILKIIILNIYLIVSENFDNKILRITLKKIAIN